MATTVTNASRKSTSMTRQITYLTSLAAAAL
jgi:hypothetical protein